MKQLNLTNYLDKFKLEPKDKITSERQEIIKQFLDTLNADRKDYKPLTAGFVSSKMPKILFPTNHDLYLFLTKCRNSKCFGACWWSCLKTTKLSTP